MAASADAVPQTGTCTAEQARGDALQLLRAYMGLPPQPEPAAASGAAATAAAICTQLEALALAHHSEEHPFGRLRGGKQVHRAQSRKCVEEVVQSWIPALEAHYPAGGRAAVGEAARVVVQSQQGPTTIPPLFLLELNARLRNHTYLCAPEKQKRVTIADFVCFVVLRRFLPRILEQGGADHLANVLRWFDGIQRLPNLEAHFKANPGFALPETVTSRRNFVDWQTPQGRRAEDSSQHHRRKARRERQGQLADALAKLNQADHVRFRDFADVVGAEHAALVEEGGEDHWASLPPLIDPTTGEMSKGRAARKRGQIRAMTRCIARVAKPGDVIVEFGAGSGHLGLYVAQQLPECRVVLLEQKSLSLARAHAVVTGCGLSNVELFLGDAREYEGAFHIGIALHFCGVLTDLAIDACLRHAASFVVSPCCYGKIGANWSSGQDETHELVSYPRSIVFQAALDDAEHLAVACGADFSRDADILAQTESDKPGALDDPHWRALAVEGGRLSLQQEQRLSKLCMGIVDTDRCLFARERGYTTHLVTMAPFHASPKNNVILGVAPKLKADG